MAAWPRLACQPGPEQTSAVPAARWGAVFAAFAGFAALAGFAAGTAGASVVGSAAAGASLAGLAATEGDSGVVLATVRRLSPAEAETACVPRIVPSPSVRSTT